MSGSTGPGWRTFGTINDLTIHDGVFNEVHGDYHFNVNRQEAGLFALSQAISRGAIHDSSERYPAGKCHPGTREESIMTILEWINDPNPSSDVLWLYGRAGAGKSAIMQTIAELLREWYKERYAGSFFFASGKPGLDQGSALFCTLAYQIATSIPGMREAVNDAVAADIILPKKSMDTQLKSLIIEPFKHCQHPPTHTPTILIDGLDECQGSDTQRAILKLVANARTVAGVPLRFLIASRPEFWICDTFDRQPLFDITERLYVMESRQASLDIETYLEDGFAEIYDKNLDVMKGVERPWPTKVLDRFVHDATMNHYTDTDRQYGPGNVSENLESAHQSTYSQTYVPRDAGTLERTEAGSVPDSDSPGPDPKNIKDSSLNTFTKTSQATVKGLQSLTQLHPFIGVAVGAFIPVITLGNDSKVLAVKLQMQALMSVFFELRQFRPHERGKDGVSLAERLKGLMDTIAKDVKACGSACDAYLKKSFLAKAVKSSRYKSRFSLFIRHFEEHRRKLELALAMHTSLGVDVQNHRLREIEEKLDTIILSRKLDTPREKDIQKFINEHGGVKACLNNDELLEELIAKSGESSSRISGRDTSRRSNELPSTRETLFKELLRTL